MAAGADLSASGAAADKSAVGAINRPLLVCHGTIQIVKTSYKGANCVFSNDAGADDTGVAAIA